MFTGQIPLYYINIAEAIIKMNRTSTTTRRIFLLFSILASVLSAKAIETEIRYKVGKVKTVYFVWGVNDWQKYPKQVPGSFSKGKSIRTPMKREGDEYVVRLDIDSGYVVNYAFMFVKEEGPFNVDVKYWDMDDEGNSKGFFFNSADRRVVRVVADLSKLSPTNKADLGTYQRNLLLTFGLGALLFFIINRFYFKRPTSLFSQAGFFVALSGGLALTLFFIRAYLSGQLDLVALSPLQTVWQMLGAAWDDMKLVAMLFLFFGSLFLYLTKWRNILLVAYSFFALVTVLAAFINIQVVAILGRPFNYQWFYYSGFLKSRDASLAFSENVNVQFVTGIFMMLVTTMAVVWLLYQFYQKRNAAIVLFFPALLILTLAAHVKSTTPAVKAANPILFFVSSAFGEDASFSINKSYAGKSDFEKKNINEVQAPYANAFGEGKIKNVVFFVLESTPWEYVTPYNNSINATPFLNAYPNKAVFENVYAHIPATNKSMFSFLCSTYPEISFKSITLEYPNIPLPSIPSELKKHGYRTAFFNSGDNQYQDAGTFLKAREFDVVEDFKQGNCNQTIFRDQRYTNHNLDGVDDSCLSPRFFNWLVADTSRPFFAMLWTFQTHYPYFTTGALKNFNTGNSTLERYLNALNRADESLKALVKGLEERGLLESTLIVVSGDHGEAFGRHNQTTHASAIYEENLHVPLILMNPNLFKGERLNVLGGISDIAPTIFSVINKPAPQTWQGENLFSVNRRQRVYFFNPYVDYLFGLREGNKKLIYNITANSYELYDLTNDPRETKNIAKENETFVRQAKEKLHSWMYYQDDHMNKLTQYKSLNAGK